MPVERVVYNPMRRSIGLLAVAIAWLVITSPTILIVARPKESPILWVAIIFPLIGAFLLLGAVYDLKAARRFGKAELLVPAPLTLGSALKTHVEIAHVPEAGFSERLVCVRRTKGRHVREEALWQAKREVPAVSIQRRQGGFSVPVDFDLPADGREATRISGYEEIVWRLELSDADGDFTATFDLPVARQ